jgi:ABC-type glycerol-3-phosphate transport system permease component
MLVSSGFNWTLTFTPGFWMEVLLLAISLVMIMVPSPSCICPSATVVTELKMIRVVVTGATHKTPLRVYLLTSGESNYENYTLSSL